MLDNFYQTSAFFPMPVVLVSTVAESGQTNLGSYSLCFPHVVAGQGKYAMMLICRSTSNTAANIRRTKVCTINFIPDDKKLLKNCVMLGYPGETTEEKMKNSIFSLLPSQRESKDPAIKYPEIVGEALQVFECTWDDSYESQVFDGADNFLLRIDHILLHKPYHDAIVNGITAKNIPPFPIDYGFRDNMNFWLTPSSKGYAEPIPKEKGQSVDTVVYAAKRTDPSVTWDRDACAKLVRVPRIFLKKAIAGCVEAAKSEGITHITAEYMDKLRDKRRNEKEH